MDEAEREAQQKDFVLDFVKQSEKMPEREPQKTCFICGAKREHWDIETDG